MFLNLKKNNKNFVMFLHLKVKNIKNNSISVILFSSLGLADVVAKPASPLVCSTNVMCFIGIAFKYTM